ncbi:FMN phosphatase YigB (HAD superfamily) [Pseudomonas chlororaphis]
MMYKLKTVDVWDTLLRRDCHPECIKLATAAHVHFALQGCFKPNYQSLWAIYQARVDTEMQLAHAARDLGKDEEYEIVNVLGHWLSTILTEEYDTALPARFAEFELAVEVARTSPDPDIEAFLARYPAERTMFLSDFYMSASMLQRLLESNGLGHLIKEGISSCDVGLNKRSGALFKYVHETMGITPDEQVHIGDNAWSDVESPAQIGVLGVSFVPEHSHNARLHRESLFSSRSDLFQHLRTLQNQVIDSHLGTLGDKEAAAFRLGVEAAPLFIGQGLWIAEQAITQRLDKIFFLTREGEFFRRVYEELFPRLEIYGHPLPPHDDLEVSRLSTFVASMEHVTPQEFERIWSLNRSQKVAGLFSTLGLQSSE